jgi:hypothetical protein
MRVMQESTVTKSIEAWHDDHRAIVMRFVVSATSYNVMFEFGARKVTLLVMCDTKFKVYSATSISRALQRCADQLIDNLRAVENGYDPVRALAFVVARRVEEERAQPIDAPTAAAGADALPPFVKEALPLAVTAMSDAGRPTFEVAERVRRVRQLVDAGRIDDAKRSIIADMFQYNVPPELHESLRMSTFDAIGERRRLGAGMGAFSAGVRAALRPAVPFATTGTPEGRSLLAAELAYMQQRQHEFERLGIEVRLAGKSTRAASASRGVPGVTQGRRSCACGLCSRQCKAMICTVGACGCLDSATRRYCDARAPHADRAIASRRRSISMMKICTNAIPRPLVSRDNIVPTMRAMMTATRASTVKRVRSSTNRSPRHANGPTITRVFVMLTTTGMLTTMTTTTTVTRTARRRPLRMVTTMTRCRHCVTMQSMRATCCHCCVHRPHPTRTQCLSRRHPLLRRVRTRNTTRARRCPARCWALVLRSTIAPPKSVASGCLVIHGTRCDRACRQSALHAPHAISSRAAERRGALCRRAPARAADVPHHRATAEAVHCNRRHRCRRCW